MEVVEVDAGPEEPQIRFQSSSPKGPEVPRGKAPRGLNCRRRLTAVFCSHVGVAIILAAYSVMGGFLFRTVELPAEIDSRWKTARLRNDSVEEIWKLSINTWKDSLGPDGATIQQQQLSKANFTEALRELLRRYYFQIAVHEGRKANTGFEPDDELCWSIVGSILYCVTVLTTVGYGHVTPRTTWGRLLTILYGLLGIPLMVLYLVKMGALFADGFRLFYQKICCDLCCCKRCERARRRRRSTILYQARSDMQTDYVYRMEYAKREPPGSELMESAVDGGSDVTQSPLIHSENLGYVRDNDVTSAVCTNMAFHSSLPRSTNRIQRDWKTQSSHVYETISLIDDVNAGHVMKKGRRRSIAHRADPVTSSRGHQGRNVWTQEPLILAPNRFISGGEREGTLERRVGAVERRGERVETLERKTPEERKRLSLQVQRQVSQVPKNDRKSYRLSGAEIQDAKDRKQLPERAESKLTSSEKQNKSTVTRRTSLNAISPSGAASKTVPASEERRCKRPSNQREPSQSANQQSKTKGKRKKSEKNPAEEESVNGNGLRVSHLRHSDESFVTALDDSSSELATTDAASGDDEVDPRRRKRTSGGAAASASSTRKRKKKKKRETTTKQRKTAAEKPEVVRSLVPMTSTSIEESELRNQDYDADAKPVSAVNEASDGCALYATRKRRVPIGACLLVLLSYVFAGSLGFCLWEGWSYSVGPYFCFVSLSTIGFGDFVPGSGLRNSASTEKFLVLTVWLLLGLTLLAMCLILASEHFARRSSSVRVVTQDN